MSNGKEHRRVGKAVGGAAALWRAREQAPLNLALEALGGFVGGGHGAQLHDILEPATIPRHRSFGHSVAFNSTLGFGVHRGLDGVQHALREASASLTRKAQDPARDGMERFCAGLLSLVATFGAGYVAGAVGGAASHLVLDAGTPSSLPLLIAGF